MNALGIDYGCIGYLRLLISLNKDKPNINTGEFFDSLDKSIIDKKLHTIRPLGPEGQKHFQPGDYVQLAVWSGKPYCSPQIRICPELEVVKTIPVQLVKHGDMIRDLTFGIPYEKDTWGLLPIGPVAKNDGLEYDDFLRWFAPDLNKFKLFDGQIICWKDPQY